MIINGVGESLLEGVGYERFGYGIGDSLLESGGMGQITEGEVNKLRKDVTRFRSELNTWQRRLNAAQYNVERKNNPKNRKRRDNVQRELNAKKRQLENALQSFNAAKAELLAQQQAEAAEAAASSAPAGGGGGGGGEEQAPEEGGGEEAATDGLAGLFSGKGEPKYLPLGKVGTPLAALAVVGVGWKLLGGRRRRR